MTSEILISVTDGILDACSNDDKELLLSLDFRELSKSENLTSEEESVVTLEAAQVFQEAQTLVSFLTSVLI